MIRGRRRNLVELLEGCWVGEIRQIASISLESPSTWPCGLSRWYKTVCWNSSSSACHRYRRVLCPVMLHSQQGLEWSIRESEDCSIKKWQKVQSPQTTVSKHCPKTIVQCTCVPSKGFEKIRKGHDHREEQPFLQFVKFLLLHRAPLQGKSLPSQVLRRHQL